VAPKKKAERHDDVPICNVRPVSPGVEQAVLASHAAAERWTTTEGQEQPPPYRNGPRSALVKVATLAAQGFTVSQIAAQLAMPRYIVTKHMAEFREVTQLTLPKLREKTAGKRDDEVAAIVREEMRTGRAWSGQNAG
jgi:hypothetical protein